MKLFHIHKWSKWKVKENRNVVRTEDNAAIGKYLLQERRCKGCGLVQINLEEKWL